MENRKFKVALLQMNITPGDWDKNLEKADEMLTQAAVEKCHLAVLPELWASGFDLRSGIRIISQPPNIVLKNSSSLAIKHGLFLQAGSTITSAAGRLFNTASLFNPEGKIMGRYHKNHLFRMMGETELLQAGQQLCVYDLPWCRAGQTICYDLRFPELYRKYVRQRCELFFVPAQWPSPRREHWSTLLRARAIENQCFVLGVNRVGTEKNLSFLGASVVIGPDGSVLAEAGENEELLITEIKMKWLIDLRRDFPVLEDL